VKQVKETKLTQQRGKAAKSQQVQGAKGTLNGAEPLENNGE
jgi:hypothetical protein